MESCHSPRQCLLHSDSFCPVLDPSHQNIQVECRADLNKPAICWARMMIAKTYTWCIFMGKNCFRFSSNRLTKVWHSLAFTCLVPVFLLLHTPWASWNKIFVQSGMCAQSYLMTAATRIINMWIFPVASPALIDKENAILSMLFLLFLDSLIPSRREFYLFLLFPDSLLLSRRDFYLCHSWSSVIYFCDANRGQWIDKESAWGGEGHPLQGENKKAETKQRGKKGKVKFNTGISCRGRVEPGCGKGTTFRPVCCV